RRVSAEGAETRPAAHACAYVPSPAEPTRGGRPRRAHDALARAHRAAPGHRPSQALMTDVEAFTDGACRGNPGPGGWGVLLRSSANVKELSGGELHTTNNRMELTAAIQALTA